MPMLGRISSVSRAIDVPPSLAGAQAHAWVPAFCRHRGKFAQSRRWLLSFANQTAITQLAGQPDSSRVLVD